VAQERDFPLLELLGVDLPGAVTVRRVDGTTPDAAAEESAGIRPLRFSLAGAQFKFSAVMELRGKPTIPRGGVGGEWIVKLPRELYPYVAENEFAMLTFAREVGIEVPECGLVEQSDLRSIVSGSGGNLGRAFYIKRFDRDRTRRIHIEDFNQIFRQHPADKYKRVSYGGILEFVWRTMGEGTTRDFVRRLVFSAGIGNGDMHLKNWSVIYRDRRTPELAPAYDYLSTITYIPDDKLALTLAGTREWSDVSETLLERFARKAGVPRDVVLEPAREMADLMREGWPKLKPDLDLPSRIAEAIDAHMRRVPLLQPR
ncbi:type II toxin-antitoxin system HipA family toxin, partial [bacterium]